VADAFLTLPRDDQRDALGVAAEKLARAAHLLEKDVWVVWALEALFGSAEGKHLVFKGGTSLSKGYGIIRRFSEDIDLTYDVREIIPELAHGDAPLPASNAQAKKWRDLVDERLPKWVVETAVPILEAHAKATGVQVKIEADGSKIVVHYDPLTEGNSYMPQRVTLEFGARATGEPAEVKPVVSDAAAGLEEAGLAFPAASPRLMLPKRTFWEKATAVHVYCLDKPKGDRISRHWYDLVRLDDSGHAEEAFKDRELAKQVAQHKSRFFREKDRDGNEIDYMAAVTGGLVLVPDDEAKKALAADYASMHEAGMLPDDAETFDALLERCADLQRRANVRLS
jgi:hypothetical protein